MKIKLFKAILMLSILTLGTTIGSSLCADPNSTTMIENKLNDNYKSYISSLPSNQSESTKVILNHIKKKKQM